MKTELCLRLKRRIYDFKLSLILTVVGLVLPGYGYSANLNCIKFYSEKNVKLIEGIDENQVSLGFTDLVSDVTNYKLLDLPNHSLKIKRTDSWSARESFGGKGIAIEIPISNRDHGIKLLKFLLETQGIDVTELTLNPVRMGADLVGGISVEFQTPRETAGNIQPSMTLVLTNQISQSLPAGEKLIRALQNKGLYRLDAEDMIFDMNTNTGRHEWARHSFSDNRNLSHDEVKALYDIAGPAYGIINDSLRAGSKLDPRVPHIDSAIHKSKVDRTTMVYRFVTRSDLLTLWENLINGGKANQEIAEDRAYLFASLDPAVARWWRNYGGKKEGVVLEIEMPLGSNAAYIDSRIIERRGYLEMVLPRGLKLVAMGASRDGEYKILRVRYAR